MVGITVGDTVRVKVVPEDIDAGAQLFVASTSPDIVRVEPPAQSAPLGADHIFRLTALLDTIRRKVSIQVRLGASDGAILGQLEPHVFTLRRLPVVAHLVEIDGFEDIGQKLKRTDSEIAPLFETVNAIWRPAGIEFVLEEVRRQKIRLRTQGTVTKFSEVDFDPENRKDPERESRRVLKTFNVAGVINVHFIHRFIIMVADKKEGFDPIEIENEARAGATISRRNGGASGFGVLLADDEKGGNAATLAHELGHYLNLDDHADELPKGFDKRLDIWSCRRLMFSSLPPATPPFPRFRNDTGYGASKRGAFLTLKNFDADPNDGETQTARAAALGEASLLRRPRK
jgi:hypothetical protein